MDNSIDKGIDIEFMAGQFEDEQAALAAWHREEREEDIRLEKEEEERAYQEIWGDPEREAEFEMLMMEEDERWCKRYVPIKGMSLNGRILYRDTETDDICYEDGKPVNSCDALAIIDGVDD